MGQNKNVNLHQQVPFSLAQVSSVIWIDTYFAQATPHPDQGLGEGGKYTYSLSFFIVKGEQLQSRVSLQWAVQVPQFPIHFGYDGIVSESVARGDKDTLKVSQIERRASEKNSCHHLHSLVPP